MEGRFSEHVEFEDHIVTKIWTQEGEAIIQAETQTGAVTLSQGRVRYRPVD